MRPVFACALLTAAACSSPSGTDKDAGGDACGVETNPVGEPCPCTNMGHVASSGAARFRVQNHRFAGYEPGAASSSAPVPITLCDYYNPTGQNGPYKLIHLSAVARWCGPCGVEASAISGFDYLTSTRTGPGIAADLAPAGVVFLQVVVEGQTPNVASNLADLKIWIDSHQTNFPVALDPEAMTLADLLPAVETLPWNMDIDARSMEILSIDTGYSTTLETDLQARLTQLPSPPMP